MIKKDSEICDHHGFLLLLFHMKTSLIDRPPLYNEMREITGQTGSQVFIIGSQVEPYQT